MFTLFLTILSTTLLLLFPGVTLLALLPSQSNNLSKCISIPFLSVSFWISLFWLLHLLGLPLDASIATCLILSVIIFLARTASSKHYRHFSLKNFLRLRSDLPLISGLLLYSLPALFITLPPGADTAMHGYITRLIINSNGVPATYNPILPIDNFGSYSAGFHTIAAIISLIDKDFLANAILISSLLSYQLCFLGLALLLGQFFRREVAAIAALASMMLCRVPQDSFSWGGNSTVLAFAFCLFTLALLIHASRVKSSAALYLASLPMAAIPLTHAIPAVTFFYTALLSLPGLFFFNKRDTVWLAGHFLGLTILTSLILTPYVVYFDNPVNDELLLTIRAWQKRLGPEFTSGLSGNIIAAFSYIKYRLGDAFFVFTLLSATTLAIFKESKKLLSPLLFSLVVFLLILNSRYWLLPFSYLLYPDRVVFFMILPAAYISACAIETLFFSFPEQRGALYKLTLKYMVILFFVVSPVRYWKHFLKNGVTSDINEEIMESFEWIEKNTPPDSIFENRYPGPGIWIPAFTDRVALQTHVHFIHAGVLASLNRSGRSNYSFITAPTGGEKQSARVKSTDIKVYENSSVRIYKIKPAPALYSHSQAP